MELLKAVTPDHLRCRAVFLCYGVTGVTVGVTSKSIDIDILYSIVTPVTTKLICAYARAHAHIRGYVFWGNWGNRIKNHYAPIEKSVTPTVTPLPLNPKSYLKTSLPMGVV